MGADCARQTMCPLLPPPTSPHCPSSPALLQSCPCLAFCIARAGGAAGGGSTAATPSPAGAATLLMYCLCVLLLCCLCFSSLPLPTSTTSSAPPLKSTAAVGPLPSSSLSTPCFPPSVNAPCHIKPWLSYRGPSPAKPFIPVHLTSSLPPHRLLPPKLLRSCCWRRLGWRSAPAIRRGQRRWAGWECVRKGRGQGRGWP